MQRHFPLFVFILFSSLSFHLLLSRLAYKYNISNWGLIHVMSLANSRLEAALAGPNPMRGFYFDEQTSRYFKVPNSGSMGWDHYQATKERHRIRIEEEKNEEEKKNAIATPTPSISIVDSLHNIQLRQSPFYRNLFRKALVRVALSHAEERILEIPSSPSAVFQWGDSEHKLLYSTAENSLSSVSMVDSIYTWSNEPTPGVPTSMEIVPSLGAVSISFIEGELRTYDIHSLVRLPPALSMKSSVWAHTWLSEEKVLCGLDDRAEIIHMGSKRRHRLFTDKSTVFSVTKDPLNPLTNIFLGTRSGKVLMIDLRTKSQEQGKSTMKIHNNKRLMQFHWMSDPNYLMLGSLDVISMCDRRTQKIVSSWTFPASSWHTRFSMNDRETLLAVCGGDNRIRIWDATKSGNSDNSLFSSEQPLSSLAAQVIWSNHWLLDTSGFGYANEGSIEILNVGT